MLWVPAVRALVAHCAEPPASGTVAQVLIELVPSLKLTVPEGAAPVTVAVKVTLEPKIDGVPEVTTPVVLIALLIVCESALLFEALFPASPL
jgi:hypothetical protein